MLARALAAVALAASAAHAQTRRELRTNNNVWLDVTGDYWLGARTGLQAEALVERSEQGASPMQLELRGGVQRLIGGGATAAFGGTWVHNTPYGKFPARLPNDEARMWEQLSLEQRAGRVAIAHRYRLEQRWLGREVLLATGGHERTGWTFVQRARYQVRGTLPLRAAAGPRAVPYAALSDELFVHFGHNASLNLLDQNRALAALGFRWPSGRRVELGYLNQLVLRSNGLQIENNHTLQLGITLVRRP